MNNRDEPWRPELVPWHFASGVHPTGEAGEVGDLIAVLITVSVMLIQPTTHTE